MKFQEHNKRLTGTASFRQQRIAQLSKEQKILNKLSAKRFRKFIKFTTSKIFVYGLLILAQLSTFVVGLFFLNNYINEVIFLVVSQTLGVIFSVYIVNSKSVNEYKLIWILFVLVFSVLGILSFLMFGRQKMSKRKMKKLRSKINSVLDYYVQDEAVLKRAEATDSFLLNIANFIYANGRLPLSEATENVYFKIGEEYFERLKVELSAAKKFIFLEYFIIAEGRLWSEIFEILKQKAEDGVEVRIIYDDLGCLNTLPKDMLKESAKAGIKLYCFNKMRPFLDMTQNNRTHRKITVIDGATAFTGGINLADEYINLINKYGHWKDTGVMIRGNAVKNFTLMFLLNWTAQFGAEDITGYLPEIDAADYDSASQTFCIPFCDTPGTNRAICEEIYIKMLYNAKKYVYINTPYFIVSDRIRATLISAAESGVDVRITVPHIPDKKNIFDLTRAFYTPLLSSGVKVYEYKPGFIHAKSIVSDDKYCMIGTSNMDFRSFYLHFECDLFMFEGITKELREDYEKTCALSILITPDSARNASLIKRIQTAILRLFAPLL